MRGRGNLERFREQEAGRVRRREGVSRPGRFVEPQEGFLESIEQWLSGDVHGVLQLVGRPGAGRTRCLLEVGERARQHPLQVTVHRGYRRDPPPNAVASGAHDLSPADRSLHKTLFLWDDAPLDLHVLAEDLASIAAAGPVALTTLAGTEAFWEALRAHPKLATLTDWLLVDVRPSVTDVRWTRYVAAVDGKCDRPAPRTVRAPSKQDGESRRRRAREVSAPCPGLLVTALRRDKFSDSRRPAGTIEGDRWDLRYERLAPARVSGESGGTAHVLRMVALKRAALNGPLVGAPVEGTAHWFRDAAMLGCVVDLDAEGILGWQHAQGPRFQDASDAAALVAGLHCDELPSLGLSSDVLREEAQREWEDTLADGLPASLLAWVDLALRGIAMDPELTRTSLRTAARRAVAIAIEALPLAVLRGRVRSLETLAAVLPQRLCALHVPLLREAVALAEALVRWADVEPERARRGVLAAVRVHDAMPDADPSAFCQILEGLPPWAHRGGASWATEPVSYLRALAWMLEHVPTAVRPLEERPPFLREVLLAQGVGNLIGLDTRWEGSADPDALALADVFGYAPIDIARERVIEAEPMLAPYAGPIESLLAGLVGRRVYYARAS